MPCLLLFLVFTRHNIVTSQNSNIKKTITLQFTILTRTTLKFLGPVLLLTIFLIFRHALPLFTSLLNIVCSYDPVGYGVPYNHLMFTDSREPLVEVALQVLCVTLENESSNQSVSVDGTSGGTAMDNSQTDVSRNI